MKVGKIPESCPLVIFVPSTKFQNILLSLRVRWIIKGSRLPRRVLLGTDSDKESSRRTKKNSQYKSVHDSRTLTYPRIGFVLLYQQNSNISTFFDVRQIIKGSKLNGKGSTWNPILIKTQQEYKQTNKQPKTLKVYNIYVCMIPEPYCALPLLLSFLQNSQISYFLWSLLDN